jgi:hypothetical protein
VTGLEVVTAPGPVLKGSVRTDRGSPLPVGPARPTVLATPAGDDMGLVKLLKAVVGLDGSFELAGVVGPRLFDLQGLPAGWQLKSAMVRGRDMIDTPAEFFGTQDASDFTLVVTNRLTDLKGSVFDADDRAVEGASVLVFATDSAKWAMPSRYVRVMKTDKAGAFAIRGLPDGPYLVAAAGYLTQDNAHDPQFLEVMRPGATTVSLAEDESRSIRLTLSKQQ